MSNPAEPLRLSYTTIWAFPDLTMNSRIPYLHMGNALDLTDKWEQSEV